MKKYQRELVATLVVAIFPFLIVWTGFVCTAGAFSPHEVFTNSIFWALATFYWLALSWLPLQAIWE